MDLLYLYIPKWVQSAEALRSYDVIKHAWPENCDILRKIGENSKNSKFRYKSSEYQNFTGVFCLYKRKMVIPTCSVSFSIIICRYFSKWRINVFLKLKRLHQLPSPSDLDGLPYSRVRWYPQFFFFTKMTAKDVKEITNMPLVTFFSVLERPGKHRKGCWNNPPTLLDRCLKLYTTLWNIWTYQLLCKKITQLVYNFTQFV